MKKFLALVSVVGMVAMWSGCGLNDPVSAPTISIDPIGSIAITSNDVSKTVTGKIEADTAIDLITAVVTTSAGATVPSTQINVTTPQGNGATSQNLTSSNGIVLVVKPAAVAGDYKLKVTVKAGVEGSGTFDFTLTGVGNDLVLDTAELGNTQNTTAGTIDLDNGSLYKADEVSSSNVGSIDICYANGSSTDRFYVAKAAKYGTTDEKTIKSSPAGFAFTNDWPETGYSETVRINTITSAQYDATTTKAAAEALWSASNALVYAPVTDGATFLVKTSSGAYVLMKVLSYTAGITGTVQFKYAM
jgi:hypothetical protein